MFSSENSNSSYPWFYHHQSPSFTNAIIPESNTTYILPIQSSFSPILSENPSVKLPSQPSIHQQNSLSPSKMVNCVTSYSKRAPGKKDRHTKISTAQGVRDRRVRLSMSIARDFFNLQDMLGFDKASKTLGWLMSKSKSSIDELTNASDKHKEDNTPIIEDTINEKIGFATNSLSNKKRNRREGNLNGRNVSMETKRREEARNRARERTQKKKFVGDQNNIQFHQQRSSGQQDWMVTSPYGIVAKGVNSKDEQESCNYSNDYLNKSSSESCNYGGFPALNIINLSTEIHINAKTWEAYNKQLLH